MAIKDKIVSFWKQVRLKSSDMFTLFRVGIGVKVPTNKLHIKDSTDPLKIEGLQNDTTDPDKYLSIDSSNIVKYRTGAQVLTDIGGTPLTTEEVQDIAGALVATGGTKTGIAVTYQDATGDVDFVVDHDAASNFLAAEHVDWAGSSTGTVHSTNIPTLNQNTTGTAAGLSATLVVGSGGTGSTTLNDTHVLIGNGTSAIEDPANLLFDSSAETLTIGNDDNGTAIITRKTHSDEAGGILTVQSGDATGTNKAGGSLNLEAGRGTGSAVGGAISFFSSAAGASATTLRSSVEIAAFDNVGNLQIDGDLTVTGNDIKDSGGNSIISSNGSGVVTMAGGNISVGGTNANLEMNAGSDIILEADNAGGSGASSIQYKDSGGGNKIMLAANSDVVILSNRASNGTVQVRANTSTAGSSGEVTVATFEDDKVTISQDLDVTGNVLPGITYVKILPSDFIADDGGRPLAIDDTTSDRWLESNGTNPMFASVEIPIGFKATHVDVYGSATSAITVYEADVNSATVTSKGTGNIGTQINITDVTADATNYIMIELAQASGERVYGGKLTIAKV